MFALVISIFIIGQERSSGQISREERRIRGNTVYDCCVCFHIVMFQCNSRVLDVDAIAVHLRVNGFIDWAVERSRKRGGLFKTRFVNLLKIIVVCTWKITTVL